MRSPLLSVITATYNDELYIQDAIDSILNQTYRDFEYIIVDGGSKDETLNIINKYEDKIAYWKSEKDNGIGDAFNKGIQLSTGSIIGIINSDDWYETGAVEKIVDGLAFDIQSRHPGWGKHHRTAARFFPKIIQQSRFTRTCFTGDKKTLALIFEKSQCSLKLRIYFNICHGSSFGNNLILFEKGLAGALMRVKRRYAKTKSLAYFQIVIARVARQ